MQARVRIYWSAAVLLGWAVLSGCDRNTGGAVEEADAPPVTPPPAAALLEDATDQVGLDFVHDCGPQRTHFMPEIMGSGCALLDYDNDGDLDIYLINGRPAPGTGEASAVPNRLFQQQADHSFVDVTKDSGLGDTGYGMGATVADIDNDGDVDLYVTNYGANRLFRNRGDGTFEDVTESAGVGHAGWGSSATFLDYDNDGWLDLFVTNYLQIDPNAECFDAGGSREYCEPGKFPAAPDALFRNRGDGTFEDVSITSGIAAAPRRGLGVVAADLTGDELLDIYVANDNQANQLWVNGGDGTFRDDAILMGVAYDAAGKTEASMGVVCADLDGDRDADLFMTHLRGGTNTAYANQNGAFSDATALMGLRSPSARFTGFGVGCLDLEHDGDLDLVTVNGHVFRGPVEAGADLGPFWNEYAQPGQLYLNGGRGDFADQSAAAGSFGSLPQVGRGLAIGDLDNDGDLDFVTSNCNGRARVYYNVAPKQGQGLLVQAVDDALGRDAIGATVMVMAGDRLQRRDINPGSSYLSSGDPRAHFGIPAGDEVKYVEVVWPGGERERFPGGQAEATMTLRRGQGTSPPADDPRIVPSHDTLRTADAAATPDPIVADPPDPAPASSGPTAPPEADASLVGPLVAEKIEAARKVVLENGVSPQAWGRLGMVFDIHNLTREAIPCYAEAERLDPTDFRWPYMAALCMTDEPPSVVIATFLRAHRLRPNYVPLNLRLGNQLLAQGQLEDARIYFNRARKIEPTSSHALLGLGQVAMQSGQAEKSREFLEQAARANPAHHEVFATLARVYRALGMEEPARQAAARSKLGRRNTTIVDPARSEVTLQGTTPEQLARQANRLMAAGKFPEAIEKLQTAIQHRPNFARAHMDLGLALIVTRQEDEGIAALKEAERLSPGIVDIGIEAAVEWARGQRGPR